MGATQRARRLLSQQPWANDLPYQLRQGRRMPLSVLDDYLASLMAFYVHGQARGIERADTFCRFVGQVQDVRTDELAALIQPVVTRT